VLSSPADAQARRQATARRQLTAIENVTVVPMTEGNTVIQNATVLIENGRIRSMQGPVPEGAARINGRGKWLIPGLMDMHVHLPSDQYLPDNEPPRNEPPFVNYDTQDIMTPYVANGVTQIMNLDADAIAIGRRNQIAAGQVIGPHMALAALIDGNKPEGRVAITPADGRQAVRDAKAEGYGFIKLYWRLDIETFLAINDEARRQ
jgi:imidazolonepropionase-like amidohydrolase